MKGYHVLSAKEACEKIANEDCLCLDIRRAEDYAEDHLPYAQHLDFATLTDFLRTSARDKPIVLYCNRGNASRGAAQYLRMHGFETVYSLRGGYEAVQESGVLAQA